MIHWILDLPWPVLGLLIITVFAGTAVLGLSLVRAWILPRLGPLAHQNEATSAIHHGILVAYGLAAALIAVAVWEIYAEATKLVSAEATAIGSLYRDAAGYPEPTRSQLRDGIRAYTEYIIQEAWPLQRAGKIPAGGVEIMDRVQQTLFEFEPSGTGQAAIHSETLRAYNGLILARRMRLDAVHSGLPAAMWAVVLVGGCITIVASGFFEIGNIAVHRLMVALMASLVGLLIFMIAHYDNPFRGGQSVSLEPYQLIHEHMMK